MCAGERKPVSGRIDHGDLHREGRERQSIVQLVRRGRHVRAADRLDGDLGEPVGSDGGVFVANRGRTVPVKVELFADGVERSSGEAWLDVGACGGAAALRVPLDWDGARWTGHLDTARLAGACQVVTASLDGHVAGSFRMELRGEAIAAKKR